MKYALYLPNFGAEHSARALADLALEAEEAGWDGFFLWDHVINEAEGVPLVDVWVALTAIAMNTTRIRLGATVTPLPRRRPWKLARETVTLDHLSKGRLILGVGLGVPVEYGTFGEDSDKKIRAAKLDEGLEILAGLWKGEPFEHHGQAYQVERTTFRPPSLQQPRIPVWVGGWWPTKAPFRRAARWDGVIPLKLSGDNLLTPRDVREVRAFILRERTSQDPFDIAIINWTDSANPQKAAEKVARYARAGATWWLESLYNLQDSLADLRRCVRLGPPKMGDETPTQDLSANLHKE
jgi:alkanesulfonate monooxygenase SsuD/methylene tetrahydromethanopterin reductase-like flavin-dependent oxidoreductase (luciferase family)